MNSCSSEEISYDRAVCDTGQAWYRLVDVDRHIKILEFTFRVVIQCQRSRLYRVGQQSTTKELHRYHAQCCTLISQLLLPRHGWRNNQIVRSVCHFVFLSVYQPNNSKTS